MAKPVKGESDEHLEQVTIGGSGLLLRLTILFLVAGGLLLIVRYVFL